MNLAAKSIKHLQISFPKVLCADSSRCMGLKLQGRSIVDIDQQCPTFGHLYPMMDRVPLLVKKVNAIPIITDAQCLFLLQTIPIHSIAIEVDKSSKESFSFISEDIADLLEAYVAGSVLAADIGAACNAFDSESQRVLVNANIDHRMHRHLVRLLSKSYVSPSSLQVQLLLVCGLLMGDGSPIELEALRSGVYIPLLTQLHQQAAEANDLLAQQLGVFVSALSGPSYLNAPATLVGAILDVASPKRVWRLSNGVVAARSAESDQWPSDDVKDLQGNPLAPIHFLTSGLVTVIKYM